VCYPRLAVGIPAILVCLITWGIRSCRRGSQTGDRLLQSNNDNNGSNTASGSVLDSNDDDNDSNDGSSIYSGGPNTTSNSNNDMSSSCDIISLKETLLSNGNYDNTGSSGINQISNLKVNSSNGNGPAIAPRVTAHMTINTSTSSSVTIGGGGGRAMATPLSSYTSNHVSQYGNGMLASPRNSLVSPRSSNANRSTAFTLQQTTTTSPITPAIASLSRPITMTMPRSPSGSEPIGSGMAALTPKKFQSSNPKQQMINAAAASSKGNGNTSAIGSLPSSHMVPPSTSISRGSPLMIPARSVSNGYSNNSGGGMSINNMSLTNQSRNIMIQKVGSRPSDSRNGAISGTLLYSHINMYLNTWPAW
jgi:hypothetical protein